MLAVGKSNIETAPYDAPKQPYWDNGVAYNVHSKKLADSSDPFSRAYIKALHDDAKRKPNISNDPVALLQIGDFHFFNGSLGRAEKAYKEAARTSKDKLLSYTKLIEVLKARHKPIEVTTYYDRLVEANADALPYVVEKIAYALNNLSTIGRGEVKNLLDEALRQYPDNEELLNLKGVFHLIVGDIESARRTFGKVIYLNPVNVHGNNNLGVVYATTGNIDKAIYYYNAAIKSNPGYMTGYENIASIYTSQERFDKALSTLDKAKSNGLYLTDKWDHHYGYLLLRTGKIEQATRWYENKIKQEPDNYLLFVNLGKCYELNGRYRVSEESYEKAAHIARQRIENGVPYDSRIWLAFHNLMVIYDRKANDDALLDTISYVLKRNKHDWKAKYYKSLMYIRADEYQSAKDLLEEVVEVAPDSAEAMLNLAFIYETVEKRYDDALDLLGETAKLLNEPSALVQNNTAYALIKKGRLGEAKKLLRKYAPLLKSNPLFLATYGLLSFFEGDSKRADEYYEQAVKAAKGKDKLVARQVWHIEKANFLLRQGNLLEALAAVNVATKILKVGYSYEDALNLKEEIMLQLEKEYAAKT